MENTKLYKLTTDLYGQTTDPLTYEEIVELAKCCLPSWDSQRDEDDDRPPTTLDEVVSDILSEAEEV